MLWTSSSGTSSVDSTATRPSRSSLGYGCCLEDLHCGFIHCSSRSASRVIGVSAYEQRTSPSSKTLVRRKVTSTEQSSSKPLDPQFGVKMSSQRSQPHHTQQAYQVCGYGSYRCTEPIDPTRIGIDRVSRKEISQSRTMPRSKRVWRESDP
jgi:hypothetical protein